MTTQRSLFRAALGFALLIVSVNARAALDESVVLYLPFDEGSGEKAADVSKAAHPTEVLGKPTWTDGRAYKALQFDGTKQQHVRVPITDDLQLIDKFSVAFWVKRSDNQISDWNYMVAGGTLKWAVIYNRNQTVYVWSQTGGAWAQKAVTTKPLTTNWTHVAMTHDTSDGVRIYFDAEVAGEGGKPPKVDPIDGSIMVGARNPGQEFFTGAIDEVALYNRVIGLNDIKQHRDGGLLAAQPVGKLAFTWGGLKRAR